MNESFQRCTPRCPSLRPDRLPTMTRRFAERHPRRLLRARPPAHRPDHGLDLALVVRRDGDPPSRADLRALRALAEENALLARELGRVQARSTQWRDACIVETQRLQAQLMCARGELVVKQTQLAALRDVLVDLQKRAAVWLTNEELVRRVADLRAYNRMLEGELATLRMRENDVERGHRP
jgi:hypothetical protein